MDLLKKVTELADDVLGMAQWCAQKLESPGSVFCSQEAVGCLAEVSVAIENGRTGEIVVEINKSRRHYPARGRNDQDSFRRGAKVRILDVAQNVMYIEGLERGEKSGEIVSL